MRDSCPFRLAQNFHLSSDAGDSMEKHKFVKSPNAIEWNSMIPVHVQKAFGCLIFSLMGRQRENEYFHVSVMRFSYFSFTQTFFAVHISCSLY